MDGRTDSRVMVKDLENCTRGHPHHPIVGACHVCDRGGNSERTTPSYGSSPSSGGATQGGRRSVTVGKCFQQFLLEVGWA